MPLFSFEGRSPGAGATVPPNTVVPDGRLVLGPVGREKGPLTESARWWVEGNPGIYQELARRHRASVTPVAPGQASRSGDEACAQ